MQRDPDRLPHEIHECEQCHAELGEEEDRFCSDLCEQEYAAENPEEED